MFLMETYW